MGVLSAVSLIISMVSFIFSIALLINEVVFKGMRKIKEIRLRPILMLFIAYFIFFVLFLMLQNM